MREATVLFFAADPVSGPAHSGPRLLLDEDVRRIREKVRAAEYRDALVFDFRLAARADDLIQALNETSPQVVHFSGHGSSEGLMLVGENDRPHIVSPAALQELFRIFRGDIRVVLLNACFTLPQAQAIAAVVGCAIGTRKEISDDAAMTFGASFYRALAFGASVQSAFEQARLALTLKHPLEQEVPQLVAGPGVDPARIFVVRGEDWEGGIGEDDPGTTDDAKALAPRIKRYSWRWGWVASAIVATFLGTYALHRATREPNRAPRLPGSAMDSTKSSKAIPPVAFRSDTPSTGRPDEDPVSNEAAPETRRSGPPLVAPPANEPRPAPPTSPAAEHRAQPAPTPASGSVVERVASTIGPEQHRDYALSITDSRPCRLRGRVETLQGGSRDIDVLVLDGDAFERFRQSHRYTPIYQARRTRDLSLDVPLPGPGQYHFVVSNRFSAFTGKQVLVENVRWECAEAEPGPRA